MSDYERHKGKLIPLLPMDDESKEDTLKRVVGDRFDQAELEKQGSIEEYISFCFDAFCVKGVWYVSVAERKEAEMDFMDFEPNPDGSFNFHTQFYNGGTYLTEMLEDALEDYEKANPKKTY